MNKEERRNEKGLGKRERRGKNERGDKGANDWEEGGAKGNKKSENAKLVGEGYIC